jgi:hypothetical protein
MTGLLLVFGFLLACTGRSREDRVQETENTVDTVAAGSETDETKREWDYTTFYGVYQHESNTTGFNASMELTPQGDDIQFNLTLSQANCQTTLTGTIGILDHGELEYIGFYDNENCRLQFVLVLQEKRVRVQEVTLCTLHPAGCSFEGSYVKVKS